MIIVHIAIVAGCLLASNNPSTSSAIVGLLCEELDHARHTSSNHVHFRPEDPEAIHRSSEPVLHHESQDIESSHFSIIILPGWQGIVRSHEKLTGWSEA